MSTATPIVRSSLVNAGNEFEPQVFEQHDPSPLSSAVEEIFGLQPRAAKFQMLRCGKCGNEFDARVSEKCPECSNDSGAQLGRSLLKDFGTKLPETTCLACGSSSSDVIESQAESDRRYTKALAHDLRARREVYSASLVERMQRQIGDHDDDDDELGMARSRLLAAREKIAGLREECLKLQSSLEADEPVVSAIEEVSGLLKDNSLFVADVVDGVASVSLSRNFADPELVFVDVPRSLAAVPLSLEWEHEFACDGGFNRYVTAVVEFRLAKTGPVPRGFLLSDEVGKTRLFYAVEIRQ